MNTSRLSDRPCSPRRAAALPLCVQTLPGSLPRRLNDSAEYSFDHKGVHFVVLNSVVEKDFWTARSLTTMQRMRTVAGLDNGVQSSFTVGADGRSWLESDLHVSGHTYGKVTAQDVALWKAETERMSLEGSRVFHSSDELGSTVGVSCDMCHPHAANTHPETYPKFQAQLGRVALLRDIINWCIQHPVRGKPLASDDPKMRALRAYVLAQRKGKPLDYGRH